jgi:hypothetical protein
MTKTPVSSRVTGQLLGLAHRLREDPEFMAYVLTIYQRQEQLSDDALSQHLNTTPATMPRLALCKRPASDSPQFADQIRQIADYTGVNAAQLANMVRQVSSLEKLASRPTTADSGERASTWQAQLQRGLLAAARDRSDQEEDQPVVSDDEASSEE